MNAVKRGRPRKEPLVQTDSKGWLAIDKAAAYCDCSATTLRRAVLAGKLGVSHQGGCSKLKFRVVDLEAWMLDAQAQIRDTIRLMLASYQQLSNGQRLIFQT